MEFQSYTWLSIIICFAHVSAAPVTCGLQRRLIDKSHSLLENMGGRFPVECLQHNPSIAFPSSAFKTPAAAESGAERVAYETLKLIDTLFANDSMPASWTNLEDFQGIIYRQIEESECVMNKTQSPQEDFPGRIAMLKTYFGKITTVLTEMESTDCAWEVARKEILYTLKFILQNSNYLL